MFFVANRVSEAFVVREIVFDFFCRQADTQAGTASPGHPLQRSKSMRLIHCLGAGVPVEVFAWLSALTNKVPTRADFKNVLRSDIGHTFFEERARSFFLEI